MVLGTAAGSRWTYEILETLGVHDGVMLERAVRKEDGRRVLLDVLARPSARDVEQLANELALMSTLDLPSVVRSVQIDTVAGLPALVREDFEGTPLNRLLDAPMGVERFLRLAIRIASAVAEIHHQSIVHRHLKPESILVNQITSQVKITDFGIAFKLARVPSATSSPDLIEGVLTHMSPEQTGRINRVTDTRSDLYSLGVTFYQMLTGRLPFLASDPLEWVHCHIAGSALSPTEIVPSIPPTLSRIVMFLLAKSADNRYQTADGLRRDLERCLAQWRATGEIEPFALREHDLPGRFLAPQRLYGRDAPAATLLGVLARSIASESPQWVLVSGQSGVGKSSLVQTMREPIACARGFFAAGKCDRQGRNVPYSAIVQAGRELVQQVLAEGHGRMALWKERLESALGRNAGVVVDLIPELQEVIGPRPRIAAVPSTTDPQDRLRLAFLQFIRVFAQKEHPTVLFFDDLQWVDPASLALIATLATRPEAGTLLLVGAYRDDEVSSCRALARAVEQARALGATIESIALDPLPLENTCQIVADVVGASVAESAGLGHCVHQKTGGNPFFVIQFLADLQEKGLLELVPGEANWRWDLSKIAAESYTESIVDLMVAKLGRFPLAVCELLTTASCLGTTFDTRTLALAVGTSVAEVDRELREVVEEGLLVRQDGVYRFAHDRVREAASDLTPAELLGERHLRIGGLLLAHTAPAERDERIFEIAGHLNRGAAYMKTREERDTAAEIGRLAGEKAMRSAAFRSAAVFFAAAVAHLEPDAFEDRFAPTFALSLQQARCELASGNFEDAERLLGRLLEIARQGHDRARVYLLQIKLMTLEGEMSSAVRVALEACRELFGLNLNSDPSGEELQQAASDVWARFERRDIEALVDLPRMTAPDMRDALLILSTALPAVALAGKTGLWELMTCHLARITSEHGNCTDGDVAPLVYVHLAQMAVRRGLVDEAERFGRVAEALVDRYELDAARGRVQFILTGFVTFWIRHPREAVAGFERAAEVAAEVGDLWHELTGRQQAAVCAFVSGVPLPEVAAVVSRGMDVRRRVPSNNAAPDALSGFDWLVGALRGTGPAPPPRGGAEPNQLYQCACRLIYQILLGEPGAAADLALEGRGLVPFVLRLPMLSEFAYYAGLALAAHHDSLPAGERAGRRALLVDELQLVERWAATNPGTQRNRACLLAAELARIDGRTEEAMSLYERAIRSAEEEGFLHNQAIACETAARFYRSRGFERLADFYLRDARAAYARWGANVKVAALDKSFPQLPGSPSLTGTDVFAAQAQELDLLSVIKASQSVSREIVLKQLVHSLLSVLLQEGGAQRGCLLLVQDGTLTVEAEATFDASVDGNIRLALGSEAAGVPHAIIEAAWRNQQTIALEDATASRRFAGDPWIASRRPRSVLCLPIRRQAEVIGLLYLENGLVAGAFTPSRIAILQILAAQAAISLQNAQLLQQEQAARERAEDAERRSSLLAEISRALGESLDGGSALAKLAQIVVGRMADWCVIDIVERGQSNWCAVAHVQPTKLRALRELQQLYPLRPGASPAARVLETGRPLVLARIDDRQIRGYCVDDRHAHLIRELGAGSVVCLPLWARGQILGVITLVAAQVGRYDSGDLELGDEVARRAAMAIENARLYRDSQDAVRLRDEFISIASHELSTPIHALQLTVETLKRGVESSSSENLARGCAIAERQTGRLTALVRELLEVSRIQVGQIDLHLGEVDLVQLVGDVVKQLDVELARARYDVAVLFEGPVVGFWDGNRLERVLTNLLSNAIKFGRGRPIEITIAEQPPGVALIAVTDHGIGVPAARIPHIFGRFERAVSAREYGGLGLGLYIARNIVEAMGGTIGVESVPGVGSTFRVTLPIGVPQPASAVRDLPDERSG